MTGVKPLLVRAGAIALLAVAAFLIWLAYLGYFSADPVTIVRPAGKDNSGYAVIFLSGDMGLNAGMGPEIIRRFTEDGVPVVGFNSLSFFRRNRAPTEVTAMVRSLIERARTQFGQKPLVLVGQSFGADALQLGLADFSPAERKDIAMIALTVPTDSVYLQASPNELFNLTPPDLSALPTAQKLDWAPLLCIHGIKERHSLCPELQIANVDVVALPGGHFLKHDAGLVYRTITRKIRQIGPSG